MKILVLGGNRFVGKRVVDALASQARHQIRIVNRGSRGAPQNGPGSGVEFVRADRKDSRALQQAIGDGGWDVVYDFCCYQPWDALDAAKLFRGKVRKYILISSQSVYKEQADLSESAFDPFEYEISDEAAQGATLSYAEGKRQAEAAIFQTAEFPVLAVRFPIILGEDDYTRRLHFHVERIQESRRIFMPNPAAKISFVDSQDAAAFLVWAGKALIQGPVNVASPDPVVLRDLLRWIETATRRQVVLTPTGDTESTSPFGIESDWYMRTDRIARAGFECRLLRRWLPDLIERIGSAQR